MNGEIKKLAEQLLTQGDTALTERERRVLTRIAHRRAISRDARSEFETRMSFGDRLADKVATVGGSWSFVIGFGLVMAAWMIMNAAWLGFGWDPYPYILLNLMPVSYTHLTLPTILRV